MSVKSISVLILGAGRSGTSMTTGLFRESGLYLGDDYIVARKANQYGFFEDSAINHLNNVLIRRLYGVSFARRFWPKMQKSTHSDPRALWLAAPRMLASRSVPEGVSDRMKQRVGCEPFCYKDPRFSVTLPTWRPYLPEQTRFLVVFRDYQKTARSILNEVEESYEPTLNISYECALAYWWRTYRRLLKWAEKEPSRWMVVSFDAIVEGRAFSALERFAGVKVDRDFVDPSVSRNRHVERYGKKAPRCRRLLEALQAQCESDLRRWNGDCKARG